MLRRGLFESYASRQDLLEHGLQDSPPVSILLIRVLNQRLADADSITQGFALWRLLLLSRSRSASCALALTWSAGLLLIVAFIHSW